MSIKSLWSFLIVLALPLVSYFLVKGCSTKAIQMPPRYFADSVVEKVVDGKLLSDTLWHRVANLRLTNQLGEVVDLDSLQNKVLVIDFFFTRCPNICPGMTRSMKRLQDMMKSTDPRKIQDTALAHFISITIDPDRDSVDVLKRYADQYGVDHDRWWMLTGDQSAIYHFGIQELKLGIIDGNGIDTLFDHSPKFVLLDKDRVVRGYYNGLDSNQLLKLSQDMVFLSLERDRRRPSAIFQQLKSLWPIFLMVLGVLGVFVFLSFKKRKI